MSSSHKKTIETNEGNWGLGVEFEFRGDRWVHRLVCRKSVQPPKTLLESVEGTPDDRWPPSPAFQELVFDQGQNSSRLGPHNASRIAQLIGRAGNCFWSASFELSTAPLAVVVDVACRTPAPHGFVGSTYELTATDSRNAGDLTLRLEECDEGLVDWSVTNGVLQPEGGTRRLWRVCPSAESEPPTLRWRYELVTAPARSENRK